MVMVEVGGGAYFLMLNQSPYLSFLCITQALVLGLWELIFGFLVRYFGTLGVEFEQLGVNVRLWDSILGI